jgi:hypothetical protein
VAVALELPFDVSDARLDLLIDGANVRNLRHGSPSVDGSTAKTLRRAHFSR